MPLLPEAGPGRRAHAPLATLVLALCAAAGHAQQTPESDTAAQPRSWDLYAGLTYLYDTNIDHTQPALESFGGLVTFGGAVRLGSSRGALDLRYDGVIRGYAHTNIWNIPGHDMKASLRGLLAHHWDLSATLELELNGSTEDRVLRNEYSWESELGYRFNRSNQLLVYGEYLIKEYPSPQSHHEFDPRVGVRFRQLIGDRWSWTVSGRYEFNRADSTRYRYVGPTLGAELTNPLGGSHVSSSVRYRLRNFTNRLVRVGTTDVLRRDTDFVASVAWHQPIGHWEIVLNYQYERYQSNDIRKEFREHTAGMTLHRWW